MGYINQRQKDNAAKDIAELVNLASYKDIGASALCLKGLCTTLGIQPETVFAHLPLELLGDPDFRM